MLRTGRGKNSLSERARIAFAINVHNISMFVAQYNDHIVCSLLCSTAAAAIFLAKEPKRIELGSVLPATSDKSRVGCHRRALWIVRSHSPAVKECIEDAGDAGDAEDPKTVTA